MAVAAEKLAHRARAAVEDDVDVGVAGSPRVEEARPPARGKQDVEAAREPVEGLPQRIAPGLVPVAAHLAAAIAPPALDAVDTTPRGVLEDLDLPLRGVQFEEFAVVGQADIGFVRQLVEDVGQRHVAEGVVVSVALAIGGDVHQFGVGSAVVEALHQVVEEILATGEDALEGHFLRDDAVVEEQGDRTPRRQPAEVRPRRVDPPAGNVFPVGQSVSRRVNGSAVWVSLSVARRFGDLTNGLID